ncbi:hypothetical protein Tco_1573042, partial [Tanacetum coccineum]
MEIVEVPPTLKYRGGQLNAAPILEVENFTNWKKVVLVPYHCSGPKDLMFVKSLADNSKVSITGSNKPKLSGAEDFTLLNHDTGIKINEPSSAPARGNKSSSASKTNSAPAGKSKNVKMEDDP